MKVGSARVLDVRFTYAATCTPPRKRTPRFGLLQGSMPFAIAPALATDPYVSTADHEVFLGPGSCLLRFGRLDGDEETTRQIVSSALSFAGCDMSTYGTVVGDERDMPEGSISDSRREKAVLRIAEAVRALRQDDGILYASCYPPVIETTFHRTTATTHSVLVVSGRSNLTSRRAPNRIHFLAEDAVRSSPETTEMVGFQSTSDGRPSFVSQVRLELAVDTLRCLMPSSEAVDAFSRGETDVSTLVDALDGLEDPGVRLACSALRTSARPRDRLVARGPEADAADMDALVTPI